MPSSAKRRRIRHRRSSRSEPKNGTLCDQKSESGVLVKPLFDRSLPDGRSVARLVFGPLDQDGRTLNFIDVGARNGSYFLPWSYAARTRITGFEPNRAEYEKLVSGRTDAKMAGLVEPPFREKKYHPNAVWSENANRPIYVTVAPGAVTLAGPADQHMTRNMWREKDRGQNYFDRTQQLVGTDRVQCVTLDQVWQGCAELIDVLKLDVEGGELEVLKGAQRLISQKKILFVYSEFLFAPYYEPRVTLGHQQVYLDDLGYRLIALNLDHFPYCWRRTNIHSKNDRWLTYAGDAMFVVDPDRNVLDDETVYRLGLACMAMGFNAFGLNLLRETGKISAQDIEMIEAEANRPPLGRRLRMAWLNAPHVAVRLLSRFGLHA